MNCLNDKIKKYKQQIKINYDNLKNNQNKLFPTILFFFTFIAITTIVSYWIGQLFLNPIIIIISSLIISTIIFLLFYNIENIIIPKKTLLIAFISTIFSAHPLLLIHPYYQASADSLHTITVRTLSIAGKIPETYAPYSSLPFKGYQFGFHLFIKNFTQLFSFLPDYIIIWIFGILFVFIQIILIYVLALKFFKSRNAAFYASLMLLGTKMLFQDLFFSLIPRILSINFFFIILILLFYKKYKISLLFTVAMIMTHMGITLNSLIFFSIMSIFYIKTFFKLPKKTYYESSILLLTIPSIIISYLPIIKYAFIEKGANAVKTINTNIGFIIEIFIATLLWMGWIPILFFVLAIAITIYEKTFNKIKLFFFTTTIIFWLIFIISTITDTIPANNFLMEFYGITGILFIASTIGTIKHDFIKKITKNKIFVLLIIIMIVLSFGFSGYLNVLRTGSKIKTYQAEIAIQFKELEPEINKTLFLTSPTTNCGTSSKIAELSNKIPVNPLEGYFLPLNDFMKQYPEWNKITNEIKIKEKILKTNSIELINKLNVKYVLIEKEFTSIRLNKKIILETEKFIIYKIK